MTYIAYDENRRISALEITNTKTKKVCYTYGNIDRLSEPKSKSKSESAPKTGSKRKTESAAKTDAEPKTDSGSDPKLAELKQEIQSLGAELIASGKAKKADLFKIIAGANGGDKKIGSVTDIVTAEQILYEIKLLDKGEEA